MLVLFSIEIYTEPIEINLITYTIWPLELACELIVSDLCGPAGSIGAALVNHFLSEIKFKLMLLRCS